MMTIDCIQYSEWYNNFNSFRKMNIDFLLYTPPKVTYDVLSLWGEVVFIPKKERCEKDKWQLVSFLNCYRPGQDHIQDEVKLSVNEAQLETNGIPPVEAI